LAGLQRIESAVNLELTARGQIFPDIMNVEDGVFARTADMGALRVRPLNSLKRSKRSMTNRATPRYLRQNRRTARSAPATGIGNVLLVCGGKNRSRE
jgi:hypothetical protein